MRTPGSMGRGVRGIAMLAVTELGCAPAPAPAPVRAPAPPIAAAPTACTRAADERARVPGLIAEGRIARALRVLDRTGAACPERAAEARASALSILIDLGRY